MHHVLHIIIIQYPQAINIERVVDFARPEKTNVEKSLRPNANARRTNSSSSSSSSSSSRGGVVVVVVVVVEEE